MKEVKYVFLILTMIFAYPLAKSQDKKIFPYPLTQKKLSNDLNVVTVEYPSPGLAAFYIIVRAGSREEVESGKTGFAHFFEHMMFRGTEKYPAEKYNEVLKVVGAGANANTSLDRTIYHMTGNANLLDTMFMLESDRFLNLRYSIHGFKTEAGAVKGEYTKNFSNPEVQLNEKISSTAFTAHTYQHTTMGFWEDVVNMPNQYDYSLEFFKRFYRPEYTTILVVGDVKPAKVNQLAEKYFGKWERGSYKPQIPKEPEQLSTRYTHVSNANYPPILSLNYKGPAFNEAAVDNAALDVISVLLFSERSDLYKKLVLEEQKLLGLGGSIYDTRDPHLFSIEAAFLKETDLQYVKDEITKALEQIKNTPVDEDLLAKTKSNLRYSLAMRIDNPTSIAEVLSHYIFLTGNPETINNIYAKYDKVTAADIMQIAKKYFNPERLTVGTISASENSIVK